MKSVLALCLILWSSAAFAQPARAPAGAAAACDRECLRGKITEVLYALVDHDVGKLAVAPTLRVTEDGVEKPLAKVGLARSLTKLRGYRQDIVDERAGSTWRSRSPCPGSRAGPAAGRCSWPRPARRYSRRR